jgi:hypothetical protein
MFKASLNAKLNEQHNAIYKNFQLETILRFYIVKKPNLILGIMLSISV